MNIHSKLLVHWPGRDIVEKIKINNLMESSALDSRRILFWQGEGVPLYIFHIKKKMDYWRKVSGKYIIPERNFHSYKNP